MFVFSFLTYPTLAYRELIGNYFVQQSPPPKKQYEQTKKKKKKKKNRT
jgi:hypothetical protein